MIHISGMGETPAWSSPDAARKDDGDFAKRLDRAERRPGRDDGNDEDERKGAGGDSPWRAVAAFLAPMPPPPSPAAPAPDAPEPREPAVGDAGPRDNRAATDRPDEPRAGAPSDKKADQAEKAAHEDADRQADAKADPKADAKSEAKSEAKAVKASEQSSGAKAQAAKTADVAAQKPVAEVAAAAHRFVELVTAQVAQPMPATPAVTPTALPAAVMPAAAIATAPEPEAAAPPSPPPHEVDAVPERGHIGSAKAEVVIGEGQDKLAVRITAMGNQVRVEAAAASAGLAFAIQRSSEELRAALSRHGLELSELSGAAEAEGQEDRRDASDVPRVARKSWRTVA